jgi:DNA-binding CsgD family transcriptional regulator
MGQKYPVLSLKSLTPRELDVAALIAQGRTTREIAGVLDIELSTARKHKENLMRKLDVHNTAALMLALLQSNVISEHRRDTEPARSRGNGFARKAAAKRPARLN